MLASGSSRRSELLSHLGIDFEVWPSRVDESGLDGEAPAELVRRLAVLKGSTAMDAFDAEARRDLVVVAADTVVVVDGLALGKPVDSAEAAAMLERLSGRTHDVLTGVAVGRRSSGAGRLGPAQAMAVHTVCTEVTFDALSRSDIDWYVATGEPFDKAGGYGIQGAGAVFVAEIRGSWDNVVGLPLNSVRALLTEVGFDPLGD